MLLTVALADTLTLKDGTKVQGKVISQGDRYWVKLPDGGTRYVDKSDVTNLEKGDAALRHSRGRPLPVRPAHRQPHPRRRLPQR